MVSQAWGLFSARSTFWWDGECVLWAWVKPLSESTLSELYKRVKCALTGQEYKRQL